VSIPPVDKRRIAMSMSLFVPSDQQLRTPDGRKCWAGNAVYALLWSSLTPVKDVDVHIPWSIDCCCPSWRRAIRPCSCLRHICDKRLDSWRLTKASAVAAVALLSFMSISHCWGRYRRQSNAIGRVRPSVCFHSCLLPQLTFDLILLHKYGSWP